MTARSILLVLMIVLVSACAGSPHQIVRMSPEDIRQVSMAELCFSYRYHQTETIANELMSRGIPRQDLRLIANQQLRVGMSEKAGVCSWGRPTSVNTTTSAGGRNKQFVYRPSKRPAKYLYTRNGVVTSWLDCR